MAKDVTRRLALAVLLILLTCAAVPILWAVCMHLEKFLK